MREIPVSEITSAVASALKQINYQIDPQMRRQLENALGRESSPLGRQAIELLLENAQRASAGFHPLCQDTGLTVVHIELGQEVRIIEGDLNEAVQLGVRQATQTARLRHSVSVHPLTRGNTGDNTPAMIHVELVPGKGLKLVVMSKGGGCENAGALAMLSPASGTAGVAEFVVQTIRDNGAAACPPLIVGVGLGGNFETAPMLAKRALFRAVGTPSADPVLADLEKKLLERINGLGIGPQGWGGTVTALSVAIEAMPCHIASLPVAVNLDCHSHRVLEVKL
jgi:fumarate hydratase subunit alpha